MLASILAAAAVAATPTVTTCQLDSHGNANRCNSEYVHAGTFHDSLPERSTWTYNGTSYPYGLTAARVNGRRGHFNFDHTLQVWPRLHVTFDGISFANYGSDAVRIAARAL